MKILDILNPLEAGLKAWASKFGGRIVMAENPRHAWDLMVNASGFTITLFWNGDRKENQGEDFVGNTFCRAEIGVGITKQPGLKMNGADLPGLLTLIDDLRKAATAIQIPGSLEGSVDFESSRILTTDAGQILHGYGLIFSVGYTHEVEPAQED